MPENPGVELYLSEPAGDLNAVGNFEVTPEPASLILLVAGGAGVLLRRRRV